MHIVFFRGEKLYVTKDKRSKSSYWRRLFYWSCGFLLLSAAVIISILTATGVLLSQETSQHLENGNRTNSREFSEIHTTGSQVYVKNPPLSPPPHTSSFSPWPTTNEAAFQTVQNAFSGIIHLNNFEWNELMKDPTSKAFKDVAHEIENSLKKIIRLKDTSVIKVYEIRANTEVRFRISRPLLSTPESTQMYAEQNLRQNGNVVGKFNLSNIAMNHLKDECQIENGGCIEICKYNYLLGIFTCSCSEGKTLDETGKVCLPVNKINNIKMFEPSVQDTSLNYNSIQSRSTPPNENYQVWENEHSGFVTEFKPSYKANSNSESATISQSEHNFSTELELKFEPTTEPQPEPLLEPAPNVTTLPILESYSTELLWEETELPSQISVDHTTNLKSTFETNLELVSTTEEISTIETTTERKFNISWQSYSDHKSLNTSFNLESSTTLNSDPKLTSESNVKVKPRTESKSRFKPNSESISISELSSNPEPSVELKLEPRSETKSGFNLTNLSAELTLQDVKSTKQNSKPIVKTKTSLSTEFPLTDVTATEKMPSNTKHENSSNNSPTADNFHNVERCIQKIDVNFDNQTKLQNAEKNNTTFSSSILIPDFENDKHSSRINADISAEDILKSFILSNKDMKHESKSNFNFETIDSIFKTKNASEEFDTTPNITNNTNVIENITTIMYPKLPQIIGLDIESLLNGNENSKKTEENTKFNENHSTESYTIIPEIISNSKTTYQNQNEHIMMKNQSANSTVVLRNKIKDKNHDTKSALDQQKFQVQIEKRNKNEQHFSKPTKTQVEEDGNISVQELSINKKINTDISDTNLRGVALDFHNNKKIVNRNNNATEFHKEQNIRILGTIIEESNETSHLEQTLKTSTKIKGIETATTTNNSEISTPLIEQFVKKPAENVEDQYNDITDESIQKGFGRFDVKTRPPVTTSDDIKPEDLKYKNTKEESKFTTQEPILPIEIQQDIFTTESFEGTDSTVEIQEEKQQNGTQEYSKMNLENKIPLSSIPLSDLRQLHTDSKTSQVPILPKELQTTAISNLGSTLKTEAENVKPEDTTDSTVITISTISSRKHSEINIYAGYNSTKMENSSESTQLEIAPTLSEEYKESTTVSEEIIAKLSEYITTEDVRPVSESVLDDTEPVKLDYRQFFITTTEVITTVMAESPSEEDLSLIGLEKNEEYYSKYMSKNILEKNKLKEHKQLDLEDKQKNTKDSTTTNYSEISISTTMIMDHLDKNSDSEENKKEDEITLKKLKKNIMTDAYIQRNVRNISMQSEKNITKFPTFIPVFEDIDERETATKPTIFIAPKTIFVNSTVLGLGIGESLESSEKHEIDELLQKHSRNSYFSKCTAGQFQCENGTSRDGAYCVNLAAKCDSKNDCSDGSDELRCEQEGCPGNFQCNSGQCLKRHLVCNGIIDCDDGSDEKDCKNWKCKFDEFRCPNAEQN